MHFKLLILPKNRSKLYISRAKEANFLLATLTHFVYTASVVSVSLIMEYTSNSANTIFAKIKQVTWSQRECK